MSMSPFHIKAIYAEFPTQCPGGAGCEISKRPHLHTRESGGAATKPNIKKKDE